MNKKELLKQYAKGSSLVLSTSKNDVVTSRMVSVILVDDKLYFTSVKREGNMKNEQIAANANVALCDMSKQMTGSAKILGLITEPQFARIMDVYREKLPESYAKFGSLECYLVEIDVKTYKDFTFKDGRPEVINIVF